MNSTTNIANTILEQLGGRRFLVMTGAKHVFSDGAALTFRLPRNFAARGINAVRVELDADDTYTIRFSKVGTAKNGYKCEIVHELSGVYADGLRPAFERWTGLATSLGTMTG